MPETEAIWRPLREVLDRDAVALALPGFGAPWPEGFTGTKDAYAEWLAEALAGLDAPATSSAMTLARCSRCAW